MKKTIRVDRASIRAETIEIAKLTDPIDLSDIPESPLATFKGLPRGLRYQPLPDFLVVEIDCADTPKKSVVARRPRTSRADAAHA